MIFAGGEPLLIKEHKEMIKEMVKRGHAGNIQVNYHTNATIYDPELMELWKHFKKVWLRISIDDFGDQFEYKTFKKLLAILGVLKKDIAFNRKDVIGKSVCIFIQKVIDKETGEYTMRIVNYKPAGKNYTYLTSELYV
jgi:MoaA/NifB/PqqE/SkfB family radical SAM enzyme